MPYKEGGQQITATSAAASATKFSLIRFGFAPICSLPQRSGTNQLPKLPTNGTPSSGDNKRWNDCWLPLKVQEDKQEVTASQTAGLAFLSKLAGVLS